MASSARPLTRLEPSASTTAPESSLPAGSATMPSTETGLVRCAWTGSSTRLVAEPTLSSSEAASVVPTGMVTSRNCSTGRASTGRVAVAVSFGLDVASEFAVPVHAAKEKAAIQIDGIQMRFSGRMGPPIGLMRLSYKSLATNCDPERVALPGAAGGIANDLFVSLLDGRNAHVLAHLRLRVGACERDRLARPRARIRLRIGHGHRQLDRVA